MRAEAVLGRRRRSLLDVVANGLLELHENWSVRALQMRIAGGVLRPAALLVVPPRVLAPARRVIAPLKVQWLAGDTAQLARGISVQLAYALVLLAIPEVIMSIAHIAREVAAPLNMGIGLLLLESAQASVLLELRRQDRLAIASSRSVG